MVLFLLTLSKDMIAALGETTASNGLLNQLREQMLSSPEGRRILKERPRINTDTIDLEKLALLPEDTFGRTYVTWLERCGVTPDTREPVGFYLLTLRENQWSTGALHRRPGARIHNATLPRMPRLLPCAILPPGIG